MKLKLKEIMQEKGVTSVALAEKIGVSKVTISNLINNKTMPSLSTLETIAEALNVPVWQLLVSKEEVQTDKDGTLSCPKCGTKLELKAVE